MISCDFQETKMISKSWMGKGSYPLEVKIIVIDSQ